MPSESILQKLERLVETTNGPWVEGPVDWISDAKGQLVCEIDLGDDGNRELILLGCNALPALLRVHKNSTGIFRGDSRTEKKEGVFHGN